MAPTAPPSATSAADDEPARRGEGVTCKICCVQKPLRDYLQQPGLPCACISPGGSTPTCRQCVDRYTVEYFGGTLHDAFATRCMHCHLAWDLAATRACLSPASAATYDARLARTRREARPGFAYCPFPDCAAAAVHDVAQHGFPRVTCPQCGRLSCQVCGTPWQQQQQQKKQHSCTQFSASREALRKTINFVAERGARHCPRCGRVYLKSSGCDTMTCRRCGKNFQWTRAKQVKNKAQPIDEDGAQQPAPAASQRPSTRVSRFITSILDRLRRRRGRGEPGGRHLAPGAALQA